MKILCLLVLLLGLVFLFYSPVLSFDFVNWDDDVYVFNNPAIRGFDGPNIRNWLTRSYVRMYVPAAMFSFAVDHAVYGNYAGGYHATNLALHLLNAALAFGILHSISRNVFVSFLGALLFAVHPAQVEPVAWISERKTLLFGFFTLSAFSLFTRETGGPGGIKAALFRGLLAVSCLSALFSKITAVMLPAIFLAYDIYFGHRLNRRRAAIYLVFFLAAAIGGLATIALYPGLLEVLQKNPWPGFSLSPMVRFAQYAKLVFWPAGLNLFYPPPDPTRAPLIAGLVLGLGSIALMVWSARTKKSHGFWLLWTLLWLAPACLLPTAPVNDRHLYLPVLGLVAFAVLSLLPFRKTLCLLLTAALLAAIPTAHARLTVWRNSESLWKSVLDRNPDDYRALIQLADFYQTRGRVEEAVECYERLILRYPDELPPYVNLGGLYVSSGRVEEAEKVARSMDAYHKNHAENFVLRAAIARRRRDNARATELLKQALEIHPGNKAALLNLAKIYFEEEKWEPAIAHLQRLLASDQDLAEAHYFLGLALMRKGRWMDAQKQFRTMTAKDLYYPGLYFQLAFACLKTGARREAEQWYLKSIRHEPSAAEAYYHLGLIRFQEKNFTEAAAYFRRAAAIQPENPNHRNMLKRAENAR